MTSHDGLDRLLTAWLDEEAAPHAPNGLADTVSDRVAGTQRLPGWATTERWISMETRAAFGAVPRAVIVLVTLALLTALTAGTIAIGSAVAEQSANGLIAYPHRSGDLWVVGPDGSDPRPLVEADASLSSPSWSPDGTKLAYWSTLTDGQLNDLIVSEADGTNPIVVAEGVGPITGWATPDWSPDGTRLVFTAESSTADRARCEAFEGFFCGSRVFVATTDGSTGPVQIGDPDLDARTAAWSPDGMSIAFGAGRNANDIRLHVMDADGTYVRAVSDLQGQGWALYRIGWSPDGTRVVGTSGHPVWNVWVFTLDGGREASVSANVSAMEAEGRSIDQLFPAYASDGAIAWHRGGDPSLICDCLTLREEGAEAVELTAFKGPHTWSPDGSLIVAEPRQGVVGERAIVDRTGQVQATIEDVGDAGQVSWQRR